MFATWAVIIPLGMLWYKIIELPGIALGKRLVNRPDPGDKFQPVSKKRQRYSNQPS